MSSTRLQWLGLSGTIPPGISISNSAGRMVEAATSNCSTTLLTDFWFSYDADGNVTDQWESTPSSGQYYHSVATFFGNGVVNTLQLASPNLYTMTYGIDGEGRLSSVKSSGTQSYVTGTTYNAAGQPTEIALTGSGPDQDDYVYDSNTGRMKTFTFQVGNTPSTMVGQLTWNPNGTLNEIAITDGFNAAGTQTCHFNPSSGSGMGYDDLGRLLNYDCGSGGWGQTFSYDQYDNLTKSVISGRSGITWNPGYNNSNNQLSLGGTTYDSDGDLTYDLVHHYAWNEFAKMKSVDGSGTNCATSGECIVYDALGRAVEIDSGSTYTEIWYTQLGKTAYMTGSTINRANWPTPGGGTEQINGGGSYYMHKDWLGNARIVSTTNSHTVKADMAFAPYGEIYDQFGVTSTQYQMFTGDTQDIVSGMMDTPNREFNNSAQGRWLSPDPAGAGWNQYAYTTNPSSLIDPSGLSPYPWQCHVCWDDIGNQGGGENPNLGLFGAYLSYTQSGFMGWGCGMCLDDVGSDGGTVGADCSAGCVTTRISWDNIWVPDDVQTAQDNDLQVGTTEYGLAVLGLTYDMTAQTMNDLSYLFMAEMSVMPGVGEIGIAGLPDALALPSPFVITAEGSQAVPIPDGAAGPFPTDSPGVQYNGGSGGENLADNVTDVRIMEPNAQNPYGYVNYGSQQANGGWQTVNPYTGQSVGPDSFYWHIPLAPPQP